MADRYTYLPYLGLFFALAWWLDERPVAPGVPVAGAGVRQGLAALFVALALVSLVQTWRRCDVWQTSGTLWDDAIAKYPRQVVDAYNNRGYYYIAEARYPEALADFNEAIALNPRVPRVWVNKGTVFAEMNKNDSAFVCFERAIQLKPDYPEALSNRGGVRSRMEDLAGAVEDFSRAIALQPTFRDAYNNRALVYFKMGEFEKAVADRRRVIDLDPRNPMNYVQMGSIALALQQLDRPREAIAAYDDAIALAPETDRQRLGGYYLRRSQGWWGLHDRERALSDARAAVRLGATVDSTYLRALGG
jgi:tetratricopeptide (TPR) repeat protein